MLNCREKRRGSGKEKWEWSESVDMDGLALDSHNRDTLGGLNCQRRIGKERIWREFVGIEEAKEGIMGVGRTTTIERR
jgi:hypothetical protein